MEKIVILDKVTLGPNIDLSGLYSLGEVVSYDILESNEVEAAIQEATIVISNKVLLNEMNLKNNSSVKLICVSATGTNNVDLEYAREKGIIVTNVAGYSTNMVAQHTFALLLNLSGSLSYYDNYTKNGSYSNSPIFTHLGMNFNELYGKTYGIIGMGSIGKKVADIASVFGCNVIYYSTSGENSDSKYERTSFETLLERSDVISIHCPFNNKTNGLIGYEEFKKMKSSAYILNLGRGDIIREDDLARALDENLIKGAGLDVLSKEPIELDNPLLRIKNKDKIIITPHIAWASVEARNRLVCEIIENIKSFLLGESRNRVF